MFDSQANSSSSYSCTLTDLYSLSSGYSYTLLLIRDETAKVFGAFLDAEWRNKGEGYYGGKDCFVFEFSIAKEGHGSSISNRPKALVHSYKKAKAVAAKESTSRSRITAMGNYSTPNTLFMMSNEEFLGIGSGDGGGFALYLDRELSVGSSCATGTFGNKTYISGSEEFVVDLMEVWAFDI